MIHSTTTKKLPSHIGSNNTLNFSCSHVFTYNGKEHKPVSCMTTTQGNKYLLLHTF